MNKINQLFADRGEHKLLSLYFCAGAPTLDGTGEVLLAMQRRGIDMVEVGIPFSDPLADGPVIQAAATQALRNGMTLRKLFAQLEAVRAELHIPILLMGYLNPILHYGIEDFCESCARAGVSGAIIPDLPFEEYIAKVKPISDRYDLRIIMLITPETGEERIRRIDKNTEGFIYMVSSASVTGSKQSFSAAQQEYFQRIKAMDLHNPCMVGFGISNALTLHDAQDNAAGAIIGSRFVSLLSEAEGDAEVALDRLFSALRE